MTGPDPLETLREASARWKSGVDGPQVTPVAVAGQAGDALIEATARGLAPGSFVADLRRAGRCAGFEWGTLGASVRIARPGLEPVWTLQPGPKSGCMAAFLGL
ncbi:MAG: hypothetical protein FD180_3921 [Planctomycetota bacterium]|nr:MAG: hypothetical protein FD180_3921 [Planctomycetota bacterium]